MSSRRGEGESPKDDLLHRPYLIKKTTRRGGGQKLPILRQHSLWTAPNLKKQSRKNCSKHSVRPRQYIFSTYKTKYVHKRRNSDAFVNWSLKVGIQMRVQNI